MKALPFLIYKNSNTSFYVREDKQKYFYDCLHMHVEIQLSLILKGEGQLIAADYVGNFKPGDIFVIGSNIPHVFRCSEKYYSEDYTGQVHAVSIYFDWEIFREQFWNLPEVRYIFQNDTKIRRGLKIGVKHRKGLKKMILDLLKSEGLDRIILFLKILHTITTTEYHHLLTEMVEVQTNPYERDRLANVYQYTLENFSKDISLEDVANVANLTVNSFCRFFKKSTRKTYFEFLIGVRVAHACRLLRDCDTLEICAICYRVGFNSVPNFNRHFKRFTGYTPSEYRSFTHKDLKKLVA
ncbi:MAG: AraC family transcriptional regulator [Cytophagales bacterium]|nr:AraC family transcriptional regulator [Cytophagales bacterium]